MHINLRPAHCSVLQHFTDERPTERTGESRNTVELRETPGARAYWEEIKGNGCKYFRNAITHRYLSECGDVRENTTDVWKKRWPLLNGEKSREPKERFHVCTTAV